MNNKNGHKLNKENMENIPEGFKDGSLNQCVSL